MKFRKNFLRISVLACVLACILIAGSMFASGSNSSSDLNIVVGVPSAGVASGETFIATVKITNEDVTAFKLAGLQVDLAYNTDKLTATTITPTLDTDESTALANDDNGVVRFVCVKNEFTEEAGYTTLKNLFTVTFTAKADIANPAALFADSDITYLMGDTEALEIISSNAIYGADKEKIAEAILGSGLELTVTEGVGTIVVAPTPAAGSEAMSKTALETAINNSAVTVTDTNGVIGTGSKITVDGEEAEVVIKGDVDGDGVLTVFDAMLIKEALTSEEASEQFTDKATQEYAGDVDNNNTTNDADAGSILGHVVGNSSIG